MREYVLKKGPKDGPTSVIIAGIHGNEPCGINAFKIIPDLKIESGYVIFLLGNLAAIEDNVRSIDQNLNRMFSNTKEYSIEEKNSYEYHRAQYIKSFLRESTAMLDIHSTRNPSTPFVFAEKNSIDIVKFFPEEITRIVTNINEFEPGGTDGHMYEEGKIGICVECGQHESADAENVAINSIYSFLQSRGHISGNTQKETEKQIIKVDYLYFTKTESFKVAKAFIDFEEIKEGQLLGTDGDVEVFAEKDGLIMFAHNCEKIGSEGFLTAHLV